MRILGISSLDKDSTVALLNDGKVEFAVAEERLSRVKQQSGFPFRAVKMAMERYGLSPEDIDYVTYPFLTARQESSLMTRGYLKDILEGLFEYNSSSYKELSGMKDGSGSRDGLTVPGLAEDEFFMHKQTWKKIVYEILAGNPVSDKLTHHWIYLCWLISSIRHMRSYSRELTGGLKEVGLERRLVRVDHHEAHAYKTFYSSGFNEAIIVTIDQYGSGMGGTISLGRGNAIERLRGMSYPDSMGLYYEHLTESLGFKPVRHEGKIVGLAAYGDPDRLKGVVGKRLDVRDGYLKFRYGHDYIFNRLLSVRFSKPDIAAAYQRILEEKVSELVSYFVEKHSIKNIAVSGGVTANVKLNQRIFEVSGVENIFVYPNMADGGTSVGSALALYHDLDPGYYPTKLEHVYLGPDYPGSEIEELLKREGLKYVKEDDIERKVAGLLASGKIVGRFSGRMEFGPRALGNRSILFHAGDPGVNLWLNKRLGRTEFMPFAPSTLYEQRYKYYESVGGAEKPAEFMTITFNCTGLMKEKCPAAVHIDGTARPHLVKKEANPSFYRIIEDYMRLTGIATIINTSFNMHEEPIVCTPQDAVTAFKEGKLHYLAIEDLLVEQV